MQREGGACYAPLHRHSQVPCGRPASAGRCHHGDGCRHNCVTRTASNWSVGRYADRQQLSDAWCRWAGCHFGFTFGGSARRAAAHACSSNSKAWALVHPDTRWGALVTAKWQAVHDPPAGALKTIATCSQAGRTHNNAAHSSGKVASGNRTVPQASSPR